MGIEAYNLSSPLEVAAVTAQVRLANARAMVVANLCQNRTAEVLNHVGTATVVRDLELLSRTIEGDTPVYVTSFSQPVTPLFNKCEFSGAWKRLMEHSRNCARRGSSNSSEFQSPVQRHLERRQRCIYALLGSE